MEAVEIGSISKIEKRSYDDHNERISLKVRREYHKTLSLILSDMTNSFFHNSGIKEGMKGVHIACGDGKVTQELSSFLNGQGAVIGVDQNKYNTQKANGREAQMNSSIVAFLTKFEFEQLSPIYFDFVYQRFCPDVNNTLDEIWKIYHLLKPGGFMMLEDFDFADLYCSPYNQAFALTKHLFAELFGEKKSLYRSGSEFIQSIEAFGFEPVKTQLHPPIFLTKNRKKIVSLTLELLGPQMVKSNLITPTHLISLISEIRVFEQLPFSMISLSGVYQITTKKQMV